MNYSLEQLNLIIEKMQEDLECVIVIATISFVGFLLLLVFICYYVVIFSKK